MKYQPYFIVKFLSVHGKVKKLHLPGFCFIPNTSVLIHTAQWCVLGRNRRYLVKTP